MIDYRIEVYDTDGRRVAVYDDVPLLEAVRSMPDEADTIRGILPGHVTDLSHGYRIRVSIAGRRFCDAYVTRVAPQWTDTRKLILDKYVTFHEVVEFEAERPARDGNTSVSRSYGSRSIAAIVKSIVNSAPGPIHYSVDHEAYPDGAQREYAKLLARKTDENALEIGGISQGQWVGADRIDTSLAYAKDGDTITGLIVDGQAWPDVRLIMVDTEETSLNSHTVVRHPETASWTDEQYAASGYKLRAEAGKRALQDLMDTKGIDYIELNPHQDASGAYDDRVDVYGRYIALVYGGGECFNAALVELGLGDVYLWQDGKYHVPELELKDFYSYLGEHSDSIEETAAAFTQFDVAGGALEILTALAYAAGGYVWSIDPDLAVRFWKPDRGDRVVFFDPVAMGAGLGSDSSAIANIVYFAGNPVTGSLKKTYRRSSSIDAYGVAISHLDYYALSAEADADLLMNGLLDDLPYPEPCGFVQFYRGDTGLDAGDLVELRGAPLRRIERTVEGEWGGRFAGMHVGRVRRVAQRFSGKHVSTTVWFTSPLRSVGSPLSFMARSQEPATNLYQFRLDDAEVGLDMGYHLD